MQGNCFCLAGDINHLVRLALFFSFKERAFVLITPNDIINVTNLYRYMTNSLIFPITFARTGKPNHFYVVFDPLGKSIFL